MAAGREFQFLEVLSVHVLLCVPIYRLILPVLYLAILYAGNTCIPMICATPPKQKSCKIHWRRFLLTQRHTNAGYSLNSMWGASKISAARCNRPNMNRNGTTPEPTNVFPTTAFQKLFITRVSSSSITTAQAKNTWQVSSHRHIRFQRHKSAVLGR
jgi:hypothetical protein